MFEITEYLKMDPFQLPKFEKRNLFEEYLFGLTKNHYENCKEYKSILRALDCSPTTKNKLEKIPFIPVRLFKYYRLKSIADDQVFKTLTSSGTSGQNPSKIFIDRKVAEKQTAVLTKLTSHFMGPSRLPMLIIDSQSVLNNPKSFSARSAGILGFSMFGKDRTYALDSDMNINIKVIEEFLEKHSQSDILLFGFTSIIWEHFYKKLVTDKVRLKLDRGVLIHGGGWKKLIDQAVDNDTFKKNLNEVLGLKKIYNYYGMIEQTGSIFFECDKGNFHASLFSDIIIRDEDLKPMPFNQKGLIQLLSLLPSSYPGHSLLTEDYGEILGEDDCPCKRMGKYFRVYGRIESAEIRGCSDTIK